jgi:anti-sigma B factor antagonist
MPQVIALVGEQTIYQARETQQQLMAALRTGDSLVVDLSGVQEADSALIQILLWLRQEAERKQQSVTLVQPSANLEQVVTLLGLSLPFGAAP